MGDHFHYFLTQTDFGGVSGCLAEHKGLLADYSLFFEFLFAWLANFLTSNIPGNQVMPCGKLNYVVYIVKL